VFDPNQDRRRKFILRQTKEELDSSEILLDNVAQAFSKGDNAQLQLLLSSRLTAYLDENRTESGIGSIQV
jgi:predicted lipid-binding transport protein (Tim44 family)